MIMPAYKTIFAPTAQEEGKKYLKNYQHVVDGRQLAIDMNQLIADQVKEGYELQNCVPLTSTEYHGKVYTQGVLLTFVKNS